MKKILFLLFAVVLSSSVFAEDVITTSEGETPYYIPNYGGVSIYQFEDPTLVRHGSKVLMFKNGVVEMSQREYKNFLKNTCPEAFKKYKQGKQLTDAGWSCFAIGNAVFWLCGISWIEDYGAGIAMSTIGSAAIISSIPMLCVGYSKRKKSVDTYNRNCNPDISYNITTGKDGLGFAINF